MNSSAGFAQADLPDISVIIPIYNGAADLPDLLRCLQQQSYPVDRVEYLLVDNGSRDHTTQLLQEVQSGRVQSDLIQLEQAEGDTGGSFLRFRSLSETQIQSSYAARNTGIRASQGQILAFTDADCRPQPDWLLHLIQPFAQPQIGLVAGEITALPGNSLLERYADRRETLSQKHTLAHPFCPYGQTANLAVRREALTQVGLFRPYLTTGGDADLCWRILQQTSWQMEFAAQAIVQHRHRSTLMDLRSQWRRYGRSNRYLHQLHGVSLGKELSWQDYGYRWGRWLLKEVPLTLLQPVNVQSGSTGAGTTRLERLLNTPLDLWCGWARTQGQRTAMLPEAAHEIGSFSSLPSPSPEASSNAINAVVSSQKLDR
jgi:glycosyltransferase involved in cell wall biosynthesis